MRNLRSRPLSQEVMNAGARGGSSDWRTAESTSFQGSDLGAWAALVLFAAVCLPLLIRGILRRRRP
ncbi:hypothetical protein [Amycolatopsis sp. NPDC051903]|uniref:hypothetical protein n=1 Tax=Amycolatopsis sp. NPDC051903 TaxID=3363936 RepID=UPI0037A82586